MAGRGARWQQDPKRDGGSPSKRRICSPGLDPAAQRPLARPETPGGGRRGRGPRAESGARPPGQPWGRRCRPSRPAGRLCGDCAGTGRWPWRESSWTASGPHTRRGPTTSPDRSRTSLSTDGVRTKVCHSPRRTRYIPEVNDTFLKNTLAQGGRRAEAELPMALWGGLGVRIFESPGNRTAPGDRHFSPGV